MNKPNEYIPIGELIQRLEAKGIKKTREAVRAVIRKYKKQIDIKQYTRTTLLTNWSAEVIVAHFTGELVKLGIKSIKDKYIKDIEK